MSINTFPSRNQLISQFRHNLGSLYLPAVVLPLMVSSMACSIETPAEGGASPESSRTAAPPGTPSGLFYETEGQEALLSITPIHSRGRVVTINFNLLYSNMTEGKYPDKVAKRVGLNLFEEIFYTAVLDQVDTDINGVITLVGHIEGVEHSEVTLSIVDNILSGSITMPDGEIYQILFLRESFHAIYQIDQSAYPED